MHKNLVDYFRSLPPILMIKTNEEDRLIEEMHDLLIKSKKKAKTAPELTVWNASMGSMPSGEYIDEWSALNHPIHKASANLHNMLKDLYKKPCSANEASFFSIVLDIDNFIKDTMVQRRIKNIALTANHHPGMLRTVVLVSQTGYIPPTLASYITLVDFENPSDALLESFLTSLEGKLRVHHKGFTFPAGREIKSPIPMEFLRACRGMSLYEVKQNLVHLTIATKGSVSTEDMRAVRRQVIERCEMLDLMESDLTFEDVAGLDRLKARLGEVREAWTPEGREWGVPNCRGLLMVGVPGCGKSLVGKALANEMGVTFVKFDPSSLFSSRVGDSEANMRFALQQIEAVAPCVVFIDEIEKGLAGMQSSSYSDSGTTARVIGTFLSWFQDHNEDIFIVATANGIGSLPPELVSRFEEKYFVGLPNQQAREACLEIQLKKYWKDSMGDLTAIDVEDAASIANHLTGREIEQAVCDSLRKAFLSEDRTLTTEILKETIVGKPPLVQTMQEPIAELLSWVGYDRTRKDGVRAKYASSEGIVELETLGVGSVAPGTEVDRMSAMFSQTGSDDLN
jgi:AAA+ superfamily predicted ATPase